MSFEIAKKVWDYQGDDLNGIDTAVLSRMAWYDSWDGYRIYPSIQTLCQQIKFKTTAIKSSIARLKENGFLIIVRQTAGQPTEYRISLTKLDLKFSIEPIELTGNKEELL